MSRIINPDSAGKERTRLTRSVALAVRQLATQTSPGTETRDLGAFISLALDAIADTIDITVLAWEKRGYWVKADRFRMDWDWTRQNAEKMRRAVLGEDWEDVALTAAQIAQHLNKITIPAGHRLGTPWVGAWNILRGK